LFSQSNIEYKWKKGLQLDMQETSEEKIVEIKVRTRRLSSDTSTAILEPTVDITSNDTCRVDIHRVSEPASSASRDIRIILYKDQTLQIREELADKGIIIFTASTDLERFGGNSIQLTATREKSRLDLITGTTDETRGFIFNVAISHLYPEHA